IALGEASLDAKLWGEARRHFMAAGAGDDSPSPRLCRLMARIEEQEHGDNAAARAWLTRGANSRTADPAYVCEHCGEFGTLVWQTPKRAAPIPLAQMTTPAAIPPPTLIDITGPR